MLGQAVSLPVFYSKRKKKYVASRLHRSRKTLVMQRRPTSCVGKKAGDTKTRGVVDERGKEGKFFLKKLKKGIDKGCRKWYSMQAVRRTVCFIEGARKKRAYGEETVEH